MRTKDRIPVGRRCVETVPALGYEKFLDTRRILPVTDGTTKDANYVQPLSRQLTLAFGRLGVVERAVLEGRRHLRTWRHN